MSKETMTKGKKAGGIKVSCVLCRREIRDGQKKYYSRQAGMKGLYHWDCFVDACRQANKVGAQEIESMTINEQIFDPVNPVDLVSEN
jgi:hypothetical protein